VDVVRWDDEHGDPAWLDGVRVDVLGRCDSEVKSSAQNGAAWAFKVLKSAQVIGKSECYRVWYEFDTKRPVTDGSAGLLFALCLAEYLLTQGQVGKTAYAATGSLKRENGVWTFGPVNCLNEKIEAALQDLDPGTQIFYPKPSDNDSGALARGEGLCPVDTVEQALAQLFGIASKKPETRGGLGGEARQRSRPLSIILFLGMLCVCVLLGWVFWQLYQVKEGINKANTHRNDLRNSNMGYFPPAGNPRGATLSLYAVNDSCRPTYPVDTCPEKIQLYTGAGMSLAAGNYYLHAQHYSYHTQYPVYIEGGGKEAKAVQIDIPDHLRIPPDMVFLPAGWFRMGDREGRGGTDEQPAEDVYVPAFFMDKDEVTHAAYKQFIVANGYNTKAYWSEEGWTWRATLALESTVLLPPRWIATNGYNTKAYWSKAGWTWRAGLAPESTVLLPQRWQNSQEAGPITRVTLYEASAYCQWKGKALPTEAQWEKAARGPTGSLYAYSNKYDEARDGVPHPNGYGLLHTISGVREWVSTTYQDPPLEQAFGIMRGATSMDAEHYARVSRRWSYPREWNHDAGGFRCAQLYQAQSSP
jgi:formylglycine-generating enzyme required for sulfatase activity